MTLLRMTFPEELGDIVWMPSYAVLIQLPSIRLRFAPSCALMAFPLSELPGLSSEDLNAGSAAPSARKPIQLPMTGLSWTCHFSVVSAPEGSQPCESSTPCRRLGPI